MHYNTHLLRHLRLTIGQNIHHQRIKRKVTLQKLSRLCHLPIHKLDQYEMGKNDISLDDMLKIACVLGLRLEQLLDGQGAQYVA